MRKAFFVVLALMFTIGTAWAGGDQNHGSKGQGATGDQAQGLSQQNRGGE